MVYVGIDVAKNKHDCCILGENGKMLVPVFTFKNTTEGFNSFYQKLWFVADDRSQIKVGLEATGHYSSNLLSSLVDNSLTCYVINPVLVKNFRSCETLRKTKTDKVDAATIARMVKTDDNLKPYCPTSYHNDDLKALSRFRFDLASERSKNKTGIKRLLDILFPELEHIVNSIYSSYVLKLLQEFPSAQAIATADSDHVTSLIKEASRGHYGKDMGVKIQTAAKNSIGSLSEIKTMELKCYLAKVNFLDNQIREIDNKIDSMMAEIGNPITTIPGIGAEMGAMILGEIGDFSRFDNPDKILAFAGMSPSMYQSGKKDNCHPHMEKRGSRYLRYALFNATKFVCMYEPTFKAYFEKKLSEGKHYFVAISHAAKKLVRLIYALVKNNTIYKPNILTSTAA